MTPSTGGPQITRLRFIHTLPSILVVQLKRFRFVNRDYSYKLHNSVSVPLQFDFDRELIHPMLRELQHDRSYTLNSGLDQQ